MAKNTYANRLKNLFSMLEPPALELVQPEQAQDTLVEAAGLDFITGDGPFERLSTPDPVLFGQGEHALRVASPAETEIGMLQPAPVIFAPSGSGWEEFLDGIHRDEKIGYVYDDTGVNAAGPESDVIDGCQTMDVSIMISGQEIGKVLLGGDSDRQWTHEDLVVVNAIAQQLAQQIETLRLLDEADRSRTEAEHAFHRLAHQSGQDVMDEPGQSELPRLRGWTSEGTALGLEVSAESGDRPSEPGSPLALQTPIRLDGELQGQLESMRNDQSLDADDVGLVETITQRLSQQMENLRLLGESRHFRSESVEAIRRLTYQSWQVYLENSSRENLAFQYDRNHVSALDALTGLSEQAFPLKVREEVIGRLAIESPATGHDEVKNLVNVITDRLSTHLDGLRLAEQREQALAESELLYSISAQLSTAQSLEEALTSVSLPARDCGARDSRLYFITLDEKGEPESLNLAAVWYPDEGSQLIPVNAQFTLADYPAYRVALQNPDIPVIIENVALDSRLDPASKDIFLRTGAQAVAILPLTVAGRWVGAIFINWAQARLFNDQERRLYTTLSRQAAVVVNNRLLLEQTRKRAQELQTVAQVSTAASTILDPHDLLQSVVDLTKSSFSLYHTQAFLYRPIEQILEIAAGSGELGRQILAEKQYLLWDDAGAVARSARERQVVIVNDSRNDPGYQVNPLLPDLRAEIVIPMIVGDRLLGVFDVQSDQVNRFTREDARTFTTLSSQVAVALQNAELYAEQSATVERLRELDHLKSVFLANMSHELRTPLNSILGFAEVLVLGLDGPLNEIMDNDVKLIEKNGKHLLSLINDVLDMAKIEAGRMNLAFENFVLRDLLEETIDITSSLAREKALYLNIHPESEDRIELVADRVRIRQVLINIISNAVKFTDKGSITIRTRLMEGKLRLEVQDTGIGVPPDKLEMIFEAFSQVDTSTTRKVGGTGLGLPISRRLVEMHNGRLWAESQGQKGGGSLFVIEMPREPGTPV